MELPSNESKELLAVADRHEQPSAGSMPSSSGQADGDDDKIGAADARTTDDVIAAFEAADPEAAADLRADWGADFERNIGYARRAAGEIMTPELQAAIDGAGLGDHPDLIRAAAQIGKMLDRGSEEAGSDVADRATMKDAAPDRWRDLEDEHAELLGRKDRWSNPRVDRRINEIARTLWGTRPYRGAR